MLVVSFVENVDVHCLLSAFIVRNNGFIFRSFSRGIRTAPGIMVTYYELVVQLARQAQLDLLDSNPRLVCVNGMFIL